jgi:hypothetical protein
MADESIFPLQHAAQTALEIQNAVNLSGVVRSLYETVDVLWAEARKQGKGTGYVNAHPIVTLFLAKLVSLNSSDCFCSACVAKYGHATAEVEKIAGGLTDETNGTGVKP